MKPKADKDSIPLKKNKVETTHEYVSWTQAQ